MKTKKRMFKQFLLMFIILVSMFSVSVITYAEDTTNIDEPATIGESEESNQKTYDFEQNGQKNKTENMLEKMFTNDIFSNVNMQAGLGLSRPFVILILTLSITIFVVAIYVFFGQTMIDLLALVCPPIRGLLIKRTNDRGSSSGGLVSGGGGVNFGCLSDACLEALGVKSGGAGSSMGSSGSDRGVKHAISAYAGIRIKELTALMIALLLIPTGMVGKIVMTIYHLFYFVIEAFINIA